MSDTIFIEADACKNMVVHRFMHSAIPLLFNNGRERWNRHVMHEYMKACASPTMYTKSEYIKFNTAALEAMQNGVYTPLPVMDGLKATRSHLK